MKRKEAVIYQVSPPMDNEALNALWAASWPDHRERDFGPVLERSLAYVCAYDAGTLVGGRRKLVGWVNLEFDVLPDTFLVGKRQKLSIGRRPCHAKCHIASPA